MLVAKELNGLIYVKRLQEIGGSTWEPVTVGTEPTILKLSPTQYVLTFENLSHIYMVGIDANVWPPVFTDPIDKQTGFLQLRTASDSVPIGGHSCNMAQINRPPLADKIYLKGSGLYLTNGTTYTASVSLDFSKFSQPLWWKAYRLYQRKNSGPWVMIGDWASDFQNISVSEIGSWSSEFCATWGWNYDPDMPNRNFPYLESPIANAPVLTIPPSPITLALSPTETIRYPAANTCAAMVGLPKTEYQIVALTELATFRSAEANAMVAMTRGEFVTLDLLIPKCQDLVTFANANSNSLQGGARAGQ